MPGTTPPAHGVVQRGSVAPMTKGSTVSTTTRTSGQRSVRTSTGARPGPAAAAVADGRGAAERRRLQLLLRLGDASAVVAAFAVVLVIGPSGRSTAATVVTLLAAATIGPWAIRF